MKALWLFPLLVVLLSCERSDPAPAPTPAPTPTSEPTATPVPTPTPIPPPPLGPGMYKVGTDIQPGIYVVRSWDCHLERLRALAGPTYRYYPLASFYSSHILSSQLDSQFYVEVRGRRRLLPNRLRGHPARRLAGTRQALHCARIGHISGRTRYSSRHILWLRKLERRGCVFFMPMDSP